MIWCSGYREASIAAIQVGCGQAQEPQTNREGNATPVLLDVPSPLATSFPIKTLPFLLLQDVVRKSSQVSG